MTSEAAEELKRLKGEVGAFRRASEIMKPVSVFSAKELDHAPTR